MKKVKLIIGLSILLVSGSCTKDFLDVENTQQLYRQSYVKDLTSMQEFLNGACYVNLACYFEEGHGYAYPELAADNMRPLSATANIMTAHYTWTQVADGTDAGSITVSTSSKSMDPFWIAAYKIVRACSFVIEDADKYKSEDPLKADNIKGQAHALRAYVLFKLVNTFAQPYKFTPDASHPGIPYITTSDVTKPFSRQTVAEVYEGMIADLNSAIQLLPPAATDTRFMNRLAAKALLARVHLFKEDFGAAKTLAAEVAAQSPLMTIGAGYPNDMFKLKAPAQTESLFQLTPKAATPRTDFLGRFLRLATIRFYATADVANIIAESSGDVRKSWIKDTAIGAGTFRLIKKFPAGVASEVSPAVTIPEIAYYPAVIRSSEMFLTLAEAAAKTNDQSTALTFLNAVRKRANPAAADISASGPALLDSIYKERRRELAFEGLRLYDLQRWKLGVHRIDAVFATAKDLNYPNDKATAPIPVTEITLAGLPQNPGY